MGLELSADAARAVCRRAEAGYSVASITRALARDFDVIALESEVWAYLRDHGHERPAVAVMPAIPASPLCYGDADDAQEDPPPATIGVGVCDFAPPACAPPAPSNALPRARAQGRIRSVESERYRGLPELARFGACDLEDTPDHDRARVGALQRRMETVYAKRYDDVFLPRWVARELYESGDARKAHLVIKARDVRDGAGDDEDFVRCVQHYPLAEHRRLAQAMADLIALKYSARGGQAPALSPPAPPPAPTVGARGQLPDGWDSMPFAKLVYLANGKMPPPGVGDGPEDIEAALRTIDVHDAADNATEAAEDAADGGTP